MMHKAKVAVLISGKGSNMAALLYASRAADCPYEVVLVASDKPSAPGLALAAGEGIATFALSAKGMSREEHDQAMEVAALAAGADYIALAGYMRILSAAFVGRWSGRMLNIHPSLLPAYKGLDTSYSRTD
jgi:phosphoribosylglycinamide formyltransferase-1